ncbi:MAG: histidine phosphatase family protein [Roseobacter sp.]
MNIPPLYVLRHGQTEWNAVHRLQGMLDSPLTAQGVAEAQHQNKILSHRDLANFKAYSSPQGRAVETARIALNGLIADIQTDERLREIGVGAWQGRYVADLEIDRALDESDESAFDLYERAPDGEGFQALKTRCVAFLDDLTGPSIVVTHGITSRMLRLILLDMDISEIGLLPGGQGVAYYLEQGVQIKLTIGA